VVGQIKVREMRRKRYKATSPVLDRRPFADRDVLLRRSGDKRDDLLPTRCVLANVPYVIRRVLRRGMASEWCPVGGVSRVVKTASSRGRTGRTLFGHGDCCSPQARPRGALHGQPGQAESCGQAPSVTSMSHYGLLHRTSGWQALMLSRWWAANARVERMGARPNRVVVIKTALTCGS